MQEVGNALAILIVFGLYFLPTGVAVGRHVRHMGAILVVNAFLGWTFLGWVLCLAWSLMAVGEGPPAALGRAD